MKGRVVDATLAAIATLAAAWPVTTLLAEPTWMRGSLLLLAVIALSGVSARLLDLQGWQVLAVQVACVVLAASGMYGRGHLWHGLPSPETLRHFGELAREAFSTAQAYSAPAPTTPGLSFLVGCALALTALAVDYLAVTRRSPSQAGLPLLAAFLAAAANGDDSLPIIFFFAAAAMWMTLVARHETAALRRWGTTVAVARTPVKASLDETQIASSYASRARRLGTVALVAAVAVPVVLPHLPPTYLVSGLGRSSAAKGNGSGTVGFSLSLDLAANLSSGNRTPVLEYRTTDTSPPPLRVAVSSFYDFDRGVWVPQRPRPLTLSAEPTVPPPTGLTGAVPKKRFTMTVGRNRLEEPNLAAPYPLIAADLEGVAWNVDNQTQDVRVAERPDSYALSYWRLDPTSEMLQRASSNPADEGPFDNGLTLNDRSAQAVTALTEQVTKGKTSLYDQAMAIQQYLRSTGGFTYSLTLAPPVTDRSGDNSSTDPLTHFLDTKQGYCVQFATAMVMMSRAAGIRARMAIGFLPGTLTNGVRTVTAADAHSWPELYLDGVGWTRFEPTPARGAPPSYAMPDSVAGGTSNGSAAGDATTPVLPNAVPKQQDGAAADNGNSASVSPNQTGLAWVAQGWGLLLLAALVGLLGSMIVPAAARWRRSRAMITARTSAERVEVEWDHLTSSLGDLGIAPAPSRTPRQLRVYYDREAFLDGEASAALGRVVQTLERTRYGVPAAVSQGLASDTRQVLKAAAASRRFRDRLRAAVWPSGGVAQLRATQADLMWRVRTPLRDLTETVRQRFSRR